jgi:predicted RNase H-like HicB family nuclease
MKSYVFPVVVEEDRFDNGTPAYHAYCPALKGCRSWGHSYSEALTNIRDAIELYVEDRIEAGESIPANLEGVVELPSPSVAVNV